MEWLGIIEIVFSAVFGIGGWFIKLLWSGQAENRKELEILKLKLAEEYIKKDEIREAVIQFRQELKETIFPLCEKITKIDDWLRDGAKYKG